MREAPSEEQVIVAVEARAPIVAGRYSYQHSSEYRAVGRFAAVTHIGAYIDAAVAPIWVDLEALLLAANPADAEAIAAIIDESRARYRSMILEVAPIGVDRWTRQLGPPIDVESLVVRAQPYASTAEGAALIAHIDFDRDFCFVEQEFRSNCAQFSAEIEDLLGTADPSRQAFVVLLMAMRANAFALIQLSMDGGRLEILDRSRVAAAGLVWPE